ncbi:hypothetical protein EIP86_000187 [Pleurotus ostreatoroseus]|nr:hypothetical protein EIP86_000187 [Pleurotus ostreatoroseus]
MPRFVFDGSSQEVRERLAHQAVHQPPSQDTIWDAPGGHLRDRLQELPMNVPTPSPPEQGQTNIASTSNRQVHVSNENPSSEPSSSRKRSMKSLRRKSTVVEPTLGRLLEAARANPKLVQGSKPAEQSSTAQAQSCSGTSAPAASSLSKARKPSALDTHTHTGGSRQNAQNASRHGEGPVIGAGRRTNLTYAEVSKKGKARAGPSMPVDTFHTGGAHSGMDIDAPFEGSSQPQSSPLDNRGAYKPVTLVYGPRRAADVPPRSSRGRGFVGGSQPRGAPKPTPPSDPARLFDDDVPVTNASAPLDAKEDSDEELWAQLDPFPFDEVPDYGDVEGNSGNKCDREGNGAVESNGAVQDGDTGEQLEDDHGEQVHVKVESQELPLVWDAYEGDDNDCAGSGDEAHGAVAAAERANDEDQEEHEVVSDASYDEDVAGPQQSLSYVDRIHYRHSQPSSQRSHRSSSQKSARTRTEGEPARVESSWEWVPTQPSSPQGPSYTRLRRGFLPAPGASRPSAPHTESSRTSADVRSSAGLSGAQAASQARVQQTTAVPSSRPAPRVLGMGWRTTQPGADEVLHKPFKVPAIANHVKFKKWIDRASQSTRPGTSSSANTSGKGKAKDTAGQRRNEDDESDSKPSNRTKYGNRRR